MFVSCAPPSPSKSLSFLFVPPAGRVGDLDCDVLVDIDTRLSAGETVPDCNRALSMGALDWDLAFEGLTVGGRMTFLLVAKPLPGRGSAAIVQFHLLNVTDKDGTLFTDGGSKQLGAIPRAKHYIYAIVQRNIYARAASM